MATTPFVHLHVHTQYSLLDGQSSISTLVDKALDDGMAGIAITDHGNMFGVKELYNYVNGGCMKGYKKKLEKAQKSADAAKTALFENRINRIKNGDFRIILGCEMYVANGSNLEHTDKRDTGRHLIVLAKNLTGYKNLIKLVSEAWTKGFYMHPEPTKIPRRASRRTHHRIGVSRRRNTTPCTRRPHGGSRKERTMVERNIRRRLLYRNTAPSH